MRGNSITALSMIFVVAAVIAGLSMVPAASARAAPQHVTDIGPLGPSADSSTACPAGTLRTVQAACPGENVVDLTGPASGLLDLEGLGLDLDESSTNGVTLCAWERAPLPLRADSADAATSVRNLNLFLETPSESVRANRQRLTVFQQGQSFDLGFDDADGANTDQFAGADVQLLVLQQLAGVSNRTIDATVNRTTGNLEISTTAAAIDVRDDAAGVTALDDDGDITVSYTPDRAGTHAFVLVRVDDGEGPQVDNDTLTLDGGVTVLGVETVLVQTTPSSVAPTRPVFRPGQNVTFQADSTLGGDNVTHALVLYKESVFIDQTMRLATNASLSEILNGTATAENGTVKTSIESVNGVSRISGGGAVVGQTVQRGGIVSTGGLIEFVLDGTALAGVDTVTTDDVVLDGSGTVVGPTSSSRQLNVGTFENFSSGTYRWVHVSMGANRTLSTEAGTVELAPPGHPPPVTPGPPGRRGLHLADCVILKSPRPHPCIF